MIHFNFYIYFWLSIWKCYISFHRREIDSWYCRPFFYSNFVQNNCLIKHSNISVISFLSLDGDKYGWINICLLIGHLNFFFPANHTVRIIIFDYGHHHNVLFIIDGCLLRGCNTNSWSVCKPGKSDQYCTQYFVGFSFIDLLLNLRFYCICGLNYFFVKVK